MIGKAFYFVDCSYYFRASYFALPPIYTPRGQLVNAVYGFVSILMKLINRRHPEFLVVVDDAHGRYFRHDLFPAYKSAKKPIPEECNQQIAVLRQLLAELTIPYVTQAGFEADDIIATLTAEARQQGHSNVICSKDKDLEQLLGEDTVMLDIVSDKETTLSVLKERRGIRPEQVPDLLALVGDKADSIPGIPGIGPKTASRLLNTYDSLENLLQHLNELGSRPRDAILAHREQALLAKQLATLRTDAPVQIILDDCSTPSLDKAVIESIFLDLGFNSLVRRIGQSPSNTMRLF